MPKLASSGSVTVRMMSGDTSIALFVTPLSVIASGDLPNGAKQTNASKKYPVRIRLVGSVDQSIRSVKKKKTKKKKKKHVAHSRTRTHELLPTSFEFLFRL